MATDGNAPWEQVPLRTLVSRCDYGLSCSLDGDATGIPVLRMGNLVDGKVRTTELKYISATNLPSADDLLLPGDLLLNRTNSADRVGKVGLFVGGPQTTFASYLFRLRAQQEMTTPEWLAQVLSSPQYQERLRRLATPGVSQTNINRTVLLELRVPLPPLPDQRKISAILSSVDDTAEKTQSVIDQLEVVRKGLLGELLTRGVPGLHKEFKQTEFGHLPSAWSVVLLDSVAKRGSGHTPDKKHPEYWNGSIKWVSLKDSTLLDRLYISDTASKITPLGIDNSSAVEHPAGTVVLSRDAGVGKSAITTDVMAVSQHFMAWQCGPNLDNHFLYYWLQWKKPEFERIAIGNTIKTIGLPYFKQLRITLPPIEEQRTIATSLKSIDIRLFAEEQVLDSLRGLKAELLTGLLSSEIRINRSKQGEA
jgi:type I restriction enzyme, S subunit